MIDKASYIKPSTYKEEIVSCPRCGGTGYLPKYRHIEHGICFKCRGAKTIILHHKK